MQKGFVSVVVPIYNVERYLQRCLESIVNQTYKKLEIILVDDGSTDSCPEECDKWAEKDSRIKVIHKKNAGLGMARNTGIEHATGEFICFFDSDDYIDKKTIERNVQVLYETGAEITCFGYHKVKADGDVKETNIPNMEKLEYEGEEVRCSFLPELISVNPENGESSHLNMSAWAAMFSMELILKTGWKFVSERDIISEDYYSLLDLYASVQKVVIIPEAFYFYCDNPVSLSRIYAENRYERICHYYRESMKLAERHGYTQKVMHRIDYTYLALTIAALKQIEASGYEKRKKMHFIEEIAKDPLCNEILKKCKNDKMGNARFILLEALRKKWIRVTYVLLHLQNKRSK